MALYPHDHRETIIHDTAVDDGPTTALLVIIGLVVAGFLIWLFAFSPVFHNTTPTNPGQPQQNVQVDNGGGAPNTQPQQPNAPAPVSS